MRSKGVGFGRKMLFKTHLAFGLLAGLSLLNYINPKNKYLFIAVTLIGSILPDIDESKSRLGRKAWPLSKLIKLFLGHRGIFHSAFMIILLSLIAYLYIGTDYGIALFIGYSSHILMDGLTKQGINLLAPLSSLRIRGFIKTGSITESIILVVLIMSNIYLLANML